LFEEQDAAAAKEEEIPDEPHPTDVEYVFTPPPPLSEDSEKKVNDLFDKILYLDMIEVHLLTQVVNEQLGISWNQVDYSGGGSVVATAAAGSAVDEPPEKVKLLKDLKLVGFDAKAKIKVIKEVRAIAGLGLKEAKELVESAPKVIQKDLKPEKAQELKEKLEAVGAQIEIS
jgi:large subunit ribosomal protein L7/L12